MKNFITKLMLIASLALSVQSLDAANKRNRDDEEKPSGEYSHKKQRNVAAAGAGAAQESKATLAQGAGAPEAATSSLSLPIGDTGEEYPAARPLRCDNTANLLADIQYLIQAKVPDSIIIAAIASLGDRINTIHGYTILGSIISMSQQGRSQGRYLDAFRLLLSAPNVNVDLGATFDPSDDSPIDGVRHRASILEFAIYFRAIDCLRMLLADHRFSNLINVATHKNIIPLQSAIKYNNPSIIRIVRSHQRTADRLRFRLHRMRQRRAIARATAQVATFNIAPHSASYHDGTPVVYHFPIGIPNLIAHFADGDHPAAPAAAPAPVAPTAAPLALPTLSLI